MPRQLGRKAFTLIELLVVISIIAILMSILLPAIRKTFTIAGQGMCAKNIQGINQAFHSYTNEFMEKIPLTTSTGNSPLWRTLDPWIGRGGAPVPVGLGCIWSAELISDHEMLFCPGADDLEASDLHFRGRAESKQKFPENFANGVWGTVTDYTPGYASANASLAGSPGYNQYPGAIVAPNDRLEELREVFVVWLADVRASVGYEVLPGQYSTHNEYRFINLANVDGSSRSVIDVVDKEPTQQAKAAKKYNPRSLGEAPGGFDIWWFHNGRSPMGFWHWFGPGHGF